MSLIHMPLAGASSILDIRSEPSFDASLYPPGVPRRSHALMYVAASLALSHGKRELIPVAFLYARANVIAHLRNGVNPDELNGRKFALDILEVLDDSMAAAINDGEDMPLAKVIARARAWLASDTTPENAKVSYIDKALEAALPTSQEMATIRTVAQWVYVSSHIASVADAIASSSDGLSPELVHRLHDSTKTIVKRVGRHFTHLPQSVANALTHLSPDADLQMTWIVLARDVGGYGRTLDLPNPGQYANSLQRRNARLKNACLSAPLKLDRDNAMKRSYTESVAAAIALVKATGLTQHAVEAALEMLKWVCTYVSQTEEDFAVMTFMGDKAFQAFERDGMTKSFWTLHAAGEPTGWHHKYSDCPEISRAITDKRLWGEKADSITYGVLLHKGMSDTIKRLSAMYGNNCIVWRKSCITGASLTVNDSQTAPYALPFDQLNMHRHLVPFMFHRVMPPCEHHDVLLRSVCEAFTGVSTVPDFIEVQVHSDMAANSAETILNIENSEWAGD